jgi:protein phosphatase
MEYWGLSETGKVRAQNQDVYRIEELDRNTVLAAVCDGMGGAKSGNIASRLAIDVFTEEVRCSYKSSMSQEQVEQLLQNAVKLANFTVYDQARQFADFAGMGTTLVAALISGKNATIVNVGDSRCYHITRSDIRRITVDHSVVQMMVDRGELTAEEARSYPGRNYITRAVGTEPTVQSDLFAIRVERGDALLLSSDGLHNEVDDQEILFEVVHGVNNDNCCQRLLDIANMRGSPDNVTSVLVMA